MLLTRPSSRRRRTALEVTVLSDGSRLRPTTRGGQPGLIGEQHIYVFHASVSRRGRSNLAGEQLVCRGARRAARFRELLSTSRRCALRAGGQRNGSRRNAGGLLGAGRGGRAAGGDARGLGRTAQCGLL